MIDGLMAGGRIERYNLARQTSLRVLQVPEEVSDILRSSKFNIPRTEFLSPDRMDLPYEVPRLLANLFEVFNVQIDLLVHHAAVQE